MEISRKATWKLIGLFLLLATMGAVAQDPTLQQILKELQALKETVATQQKQIAELKARLEQRKNTNEQVVEQVVDAKLAEKHAAALKLGRNIDSLKIRGDFFVRYETRTNDTGDPANPEENRDRLRSRLRLGFVWTNRKENWEIGVGLATGTVIGHGCTDTWSEQEIFESGDIRLDYAYARHTRDHLNLTLGQQKNPFYTTQMVWDKDYRPVGFTAQLHAGGAFATLGYYDVLWGPNLKKDADDADVMLTAVQIGKKWEISKNTHALTAVTGYFLSDSFRDATKHTDYNPYKYSAGLYDVDPDYHIHLCDLYAQLETKAGPVGLKLYTQIAKNLGANCDKSQQGGSIDPEANDLAWLLGFDARYERFKLRYYYTRIEADSVFGPLKFDTFGAGAGLTDTDIAGHYIGLFYYLTSHLSLGVKAMLLGQIEGDRDAQLYQFDAKYVF